MISRAMLSLVVGLAFQTVCHAADRTPSTGQTVYIPMTEGVVIERPAK